MTGTVVVLGAAGRLGPAIVAALEADGRQVVGVARGDLGGFDALDPVWHDPARWRSALASSGTPPGSIVAVVNLIAGKASTAAVGRASVRAAAALRETADGILAIHVGSVAEWRAGRPSDYAAGKIAARAEAKARALDVVLTLGVVPRPPGDPTTHWYAGTPGWCRRSAR